MTFGTLEITNLVNDNVPSAPSIPETPGISNFANFTEAITCKEKALQHSAKLLELRSKFNTADIKTASINSILVTVLSSGIKVNFTKDPLTDVNLDLPANKITSPKTGEVEDCLSTSLLPDIPIPGLEDASKFVSLVAEEVDNRLSDFTNDLESGVSEVNSFLGDISKTLCAPEDFPIFKLFTELEDFLSNSGFNQIYNEWKELDKCIRLNCKIMSDILMDDSFLWDDAEKTQFKLPIDLSGGGLRIANFMNNPSPQQIKSLNDMEGRFKDFKKAKASVAKIGQNVAKNNNVADELNPFSSVLVTLENSSNATVNVLV